MRKNKSNPVNLAGVLAVTFAAGLALGACVSEKKIEKACQKYCDQAAQCDDQVTAKDCTDACVTALTLCQLHERGEALDQVKECGKTSCDDLLACEVNAGVQCVFGLGL